jgi:hypothetical protein
MMKGFVDHPWPWTSILITFYIGIGGIIHVINLVLIMISFLLTIQPDSHACLYYCNLHAQHGSRIVFTQMGQTRASCLSVNWALFIGRLRPKPAVVWYYPPLALRP